ncbi:MAG: hypothetical protein EB027_05275, partial [Actinobacteria bacterium]|nr:hypothetical protein [Actinomycetota bacterium]
MAVFAEPTWGAEWVDGLTGVFSPGEQLACYSRCYTEVWHERWNASKSRNDLIYGGLVWQQVALSNANLWFMSWRQQRVKTGFLSSEIVTYPEPVESMSVPITQVASLATRRVDPAMESQRSLRKLLGVKPTQVSLLSLTFTGGAVQVLSPYLEFESLVASLKNAMTGATLA